MKKLFDSCHWVWLSMPLLMALTVFIWSDHYNMGNEATYWFLVILIFVFSILFFSALIYNLIVFVRSLLSKK